MSHDIKTVKGSKGGKSGGGGSAPYEAPDNLLVDSTAYIIDLISEGEIEGWANPAMPGTCIFFDDTPLQNADGTFNFEGVEYWLREGTPDQDPVPGFSAVENEISVGVEITEPIPVVRSIAGDDIDAVRIKVGVSNLSTLDVNTGDLTEATVEFDIEMQVGVAAFEKIGSYSISGKTTSGYQRGYRIELPPLRPVNFKIVRTTPDATSSELQDSLFFISMTEIIDAKLSYPNTAYVALAIPAAAFGGSIPRRSYRMKGVICWVPSNYDPVARTYDETTIWDGTFKLAYTSNPAFFTYTVYIENRWGLGERISVALVDKWNIYTIGKYCDGMVDDGFGGLEPRFQLNGVMNTRKRAYDVITQLSAAMRAVTYWGLGSVVTVQDAPADPVKLVVNANVVGGNFNYSGTALAARKTAAVASFRHPDDHFRLKPGIVYEDVDAIARFGRRQVDLSMPFNTSPGAALRYCKWLVDTNINQTEMVNYQAGFDHASLRPGNRILISDKYRVGYRMAGRILSINPDRVTVTLDDKVYLEAGETHTLMVTTDVGKFEEYAFAGSLSGNHSVIVVDTALPSDILHGTPFVVKATNLLPRLFSCLSNKPEDNLYSVVAAQDDANKYARVEQDILVDDGDPYILPNINLVPAAPSSVNVDVWYGSQPAGIVATATWPVSADSPVATYRVEFTNSSGVRNFVQDTRTVSLDIPIAGNHKGPYKIHVAAENALQSRSIFTTKEFTIPNSVLIPDMVTGFRIKLLGDQAQLAWNAGKANVSHFYIRHVPVGVAAKWARGIDVDADVVGRSIQVAALPGTYMIKAVSVFGTVSDVAAIITNVGSSLVNYNVVSVMDEAPLFLGVKSTGVTIDGDALVMDGVYSGEYLFDQQLDLTDVYQSRLSARFVGFGVSENNFMSGWIPLSGVERLAGEVSESLWDVTLQIRTTLDDPASPSAVWSDWIAFRVGDEIARGYEFKVVMNIADLNASIRIVELEVSVDMPDRVVGGDDIDCPVGGVYVTFSPAFKERPAITVTGQELPTGARDIRSNVTGAGFHQKYVNSSDGDIAASFDWVAKGYGRVG